MVRLRKTAVWLTLLLFVTGAPAFSADEAADITEEVLTGPNDMDPEKILGPGAIGIQTSKNILMSFGATVRFIPTAESDWDFGLSDTVPGYVNTEPIKQFAGGAYQTAQTANDVYQSTIALNDALTAGRSARSALDDLANALSSAEAVIGATADPATAAGISQAAEGAAQLQSAVVAAVLGAGGSAAEEYQQAIQNNDPLAAEALQAIAANPQYQAAVAAGDMEAASAIATQIATPFVVQYAGNAAEQAAEDVISDQAEPLLAGADQIVSGVAQGINNDPDATAADIGEALAYTTILKAKADGFSPYYLADSFLRTHNNESGSVNDGYVRNETKIFFNAMPKNKKWSFYAALEYDRPIDTETIDNRGGKTDSSSNFGLERLNASVELVEGLRFHGGWDVWGVDIIEAGSMVYGDDNAGFWLNGDYEPYNFSIAWHKLEENDFQVNTQSHTGSSDADRDLFAGYFDYFVNEENKVRFFGTYDRIRNVPSLDLLGALAAEADLADYAGIYGNNGIPGAPATAPDTDAYTLGGYYTGKFGMLELMAEGAYKFGEATDTGLQGVDNGRHVIAYDDFDISSYALAGDVALELGDSVGWMSLRPHIGFTYTSGDDDSGDDTLEGYSGVANAQRFSRAFGGENTIIGDTNFVLGTALYGYIPEYYGNGTPVFVGGLQNMTGTGNGRGDNPGLTMLSVGLSLRPVIYLIYRSNVNMFNWNEDFYVTDMVNPVTTTTLATGGKKSPTLVEGGYVGTEWDNEVTLGLSPNMFIRGQFSFFFPGDGIEDVTRAISGGEEASDEIASRIAGEFIWNF